MNNRLESNDSYLYEQVVGKIAGLIGQRVLRPGDRIPSVRRLSSQMDVSISTVLQAYLLLESKGLIEARPQSGYFVKLRVDKLPPEPKTSSPSASATPVGVSELVSKCWRRPETRKLFPWVQQP